MPVSVLMRCVPAWDIDLMSAFLAVEPTPEERVERRVAEFMAMWASSKGRSESTAEDFLPHLKAWQPGADLPPDDLALMRTLRGARVN
jgi:hypothetical protein